MNDILIITVLTVNPTVLPVYSGKLFKELFLQKKEKVLEGAVGNEDRDTIVELNKVQVPPLKLSLHSLTRSNSSPKKSNDDIRENEEYAESDLTLLTGFPELKIVHVKPLKTEFSNLMAKKFITNNNTIHTKFQRSDTKINGNREIFVSKLSLGHIGLMKIFSNVSMNVLDNIHSLIPDLGLVTPKGPSILNIFI